MVKKDKSLGFQCSQPDVDCQWEVKDDPIVDEVYGDLEPAVELIGAAAVTKVL